MNSMLVPGAWCPVSRHTSARSPSSADVRVGGAPVRDVHHIEGRLEELVLQHQSLLRAHVLVDGGQRLGQTFLASPDVALARVVGAVGEPDLQVPRTRLVHHLQAVQVVFDGLLAHRLVDVGKAAELVVVILEGIGVDGPDPHSEIAGVVGQRPVVVDLVPRDVQCDSGSQPGETVHGGGIGDLLPDIARRARGSEHLEPGAGVPEGPGR